MIFMGIGYRISGSMPLYMNEIRFHLTQVGSILLVIHIKKIAIFAEWEKMG